MLLMESNHGLVVLLERANGTVLGLVTLHDLLRAQMSLGRENGGMKDAGANAKS
jgi:hypothetical protein